MPYMCLLIYTNIENHCITRERERERERERDLVDEIVYSVSSKSHYRTHGMLYASKIEITV